MQSARRVGWGYGAIRDRISPSAISTRILLMVSCVAILVGVAFRFYNVDKKVYWNDEIYSTLHVLGYTESDVVERAYDITRVAQLQAYLHVDRQHGQRGIDATVGALVREDAEHPPLYFAIAHYWVTLIGDSILAQRMLSVVLSVVFLPCVFWLSMELIDDRLTAAAATALVSVSPMFVLYSQENREYTLWALLVVVASASLCRAIRVKKTSAWASYIIAATAALYTYPFTAFVLCAHVAWGLAWVRKAAPESVRPLVLSVVTASLLFVPWAVVVWIYRAPIERGLAWTVQGHNSPIKTLAAFFGTFKYAFVDLGIARHSLVNVSFAVGAVLVVGWALLELSRSRERKALTFVIIVGAFAAAPLLLLDLIGPGVRSANPRYFFPLFVGIDLTVGFAIVTMASRNVRWNAPAMVLLGLGAYSCGLSSQSETWWTKYGERSIQVADTINASSKPIVIGDNHISYALSLSNYLDPRTRLYLRPSCYLCVDRATTYRSLNETLSSFRPSETFLLGPSSAFLRRIARVESIDKDRIISIGGRSKSKVHLW